MKPTIRNIILFAALALLAASCNKNEGPTIPAYLHIDKVTITHPTDGTTATYGDGFLTADVYAVRIECVLDGVDTTTAIGSFELPCTVPLLTDRHKIKKLTVYPLVKQNGIAATTIPYPFYETYVDSNIYVTPDSVTNIGTQDAEGLWGIRVPYKSTRYINILKTEFFEPLQLNIAFDSTVERVNNADSARSGQGFGRVHFTADESTKTFYMTDELTETDATAYLYMEMDYWTDCRLQIGMRSAYTSGGTTSLSGVYTLYPNKKWQKIYINLGKTWANFNYNSTFKLAFTVLNMDGTDGDVRLDNIKVLSY